jgi:hypothetical protein
MRLAPEPCAAHLRGADVLILEPSRPQTQTVTAEWRCYPWLALTAWGQWIKMDRIPQTTPSDLPVVEVAMSLCWCSNTEENKAPLNVRLLLAVDEFLFEDIPRCAGLLSIWASAGAAWFLWVDYLWCIRYHC